MIFIYFLCEVKGFVESVKIVVSSALFMQLRI